MPPPGTTCSHGHTSGGFLWGGVALPNRGDGFMRARPGDSTNWGTPALVNALLGGAASVARQFPGSQPLRIGDLSGPGGGRHPRHRSHRSGRDADVVYYVLDEAGRTTHGRGWLAFDQRGLAREGAHRSGKVFYFDDARNWHFVRTLLADEDAGVQWIFCSRGVKSRLLRYAVAVERSPAVLFRAAWVLQQPSNAAPHADHFHVRVTCSSDDRVAGCVDTGPLWPWLRRERDKPPAAGLESLDDLALVRALLADDDEASGPSRR